MPAYRYRFVGAEPEDFPAPPVARTLQPGEEIEASEPVEHARLELIPAETPKGLKATPSAEPGAQGGS